jgi:hypothetical protein
MTTRGNSWYWNKERLADLQKILLTAANWEEVRIRMKQLGTDTNCHNLQTYAYRNKMIKPNIKQGGWRGGSHV